MFADKERLYLLMEYVPGGELFKRLREAPPRAPVLHRALHESAWLLEPIPDRPVQASCMQMPRMCSRVDFPCRTSAVNIYQNLACRSSLCHHGATMMAHLWAAGAWAQAAAGGGALLCRGCGACA